MEHLSKVCYINTDSTQKTLKVTAHRGVRADNSKPTRNFGIGDKMLRYKCIRKCFFMNLFGTNNAGESL